MTQEYPAVELSTAKGGGYILSQSHTHGAVDPTRLKWMIEAAHKYGRYPIAIQDRDQGCILDRERMVKL